MSNTPIKIALAGNMRSGKTTIAKYLSKEYQFDEYSFANALKNVANYLFDNSKVYPNSRSKPRKLYQDLGQKMRELDPDVWINVVEEHINSMIDATFVYGVVIDDLRQPNEYEWARENGFTIIKVESPEYVRIDRMKASNDAFTPDLLNHDTEQHIDTFKYDYVIKNNGSMKDLEQQVEEVLECIMP